MSKATLTMIGMYRWDSDLFKNLILPAGVDRDTEINTILLQAGEFEVLYSDFDFMEEMIGVISKKWQRTFQKWYDALQLEYNPIENYDRYETWTDTGKNTENSTRGSNRSLTGSDKEDTSGSDSENISGSSSDQSHSNSTTDTYVTPYDSDALHQDNESRSSQDANSTGSTRQDTSRSNSQNTAKNTSENETTSDNENRNLTNSSDHSGHLHGNIGVTTSQEMLEAELDIDAWNLYEHIADVFVRELCIPVY